MFRILVKFSFVLCLFALLGCMSAFAQNGQISGQVSDPDGAAVPGARVQVINRDTNGMNKAKTGTTGLYTVAFLPSGRYRVVVQAAGCSVVTSENIDLSQGRACSCSTCNSPSVP